MASFLHAIEVFVFATTSAGCRQVLVEAMAASKPVMASDVTPRTEILQNKDIAVFVDLANPAACADALARVFDDTIDRSRIGQLARQRREAHFSVEE